MKKNMTLKNILLLQLVIVIYTLSSIFAKLASGQELFTLPFFLFYGCEIAILGLYALLWQQMIKRFELSVAYANRAMALIWSLLWAVIFFREQVTVKKIAGILLVILGTAIINGGGEE